MRLSRILLGSRGKFEFFPLEFFGFRGVCDRRPGDYSSARDSLMMIKTALGGDTKTRADALSCVRDQNWGWGKNE